MRKLSLLFLLAACSIAVAQDTPSRQLERQKDSVKAWPNQSKRWALLIGVDQYRDAQISSLKGSVNDAHLLANALVRYAGFPEDQVIVLATDLPEERQPTRINIWTYLSNLASLVPKDGLLLISFAGHGIERNGQAYLIPSDARLTHDVSLLEESAVSVTRMRDRIKAIGASQVIVLLDACRNDPGGRADAPNNMTSAYTKFNFDVRNSEVQAFATIYATAIGQRAYEYTEKHQGYFTWAIIEALKGKAANEKGEITLAALLKYVQDNVPKRIAIDLGAEQKQKPFAIIEGYRADELVVAVGGPKTREDRGTGNISEASKEQALWEAIRNSNDRQGFSDYLARYPNGSYAGAARAKLRILDAPKSGDTNSTTGGATESSVARARAELRERGIGVDVSSVKNVLISVDVELLKLLTAAAVPPTIIEEALRQRADSEKGTVARRFFENSKKSPDAMKWFDSALANGVNPNFTVKTGGYYESEGVLWEALRAGNMVAIKILIGRGASPHAYQDLFLTRYPLMRFIFPIRYIADDDVLDQSEKQTLTKLFIEAGAVVPYVTGEGGMGWGSVMYQAKGLRDEDAQRLGMTLTPSRPFCEQAENPICKRAGGDWCATLKKMPNKLKYDYTRGVPLPVTDITLVYLLNIEGNKAYFLGLTGKSPSYGYEYLLVEVSKDASSWTMMSYMSSEYGMGLCKKDEDGRESDRCWRRIAPYRVAGTDELRLADFNLSWTLTKENCSSVLPPATPEKKQ